MKFSPKFDPSGFKIVALLISGALGVIAMFYVFNLRINLTASHVPVGLWRVVAIDGPDDIKVTDVVEYDVRDFYSLRPEAREERMEFKAARILKSVAALGGAVIALSGDVLTIDGTEYKNAKILKGWSKVEYPLVVPVGEVWLMNDSELAYDSRYHGPMPISLIRGKCVPLIVYE